MMMLCGKWMGVLCGVLMFAVVGIVSAEEPETDTGMLRVGSVSFEATALGEALMDEEAGYAYFVVGDSIVKIAVGARTDPPRVVATTKLGETLGSAVIDPQNGYAYVASAQGGRIHKIALGEGDDPTTLTAVSKHGYGHSRRSTAVIDPAAGYAYFGFGSLVVKVSLGEGEAAPTVVGIVLLTLVEFESRIIHSAVIDPLNGYAYFSISDGPTSPGAVVKVALGEGSSAPTRVGEAGAFPWGFPLNDYMWFPAATIDLEQGRAYFIYRRYSRNVLFQIGLGDGNDPPVHLSTREFSTLTTVGSAAFEQERGYIYLTSGNEILKMTPGDGSSAPVTVERLPVAPELGAIAFAPSRNTILVGAKVAGSTSASVHKVITDADKTLSLPSSWHFAEGATHPTFQTYYLLANPNDEPLKIEAEYLPESGPPITRTVTVQANSRRTILANEVLPNQGLSASFRAPSGKGFAAERAMYSMGPNNRWYGAHAAVGVTEPAYTWYFAEGSAGPAGPGGDPFRTYILVANPNDAPVTAHLSVSSPTSPGGAFSMIIPPKSRVTIEPEREIVGLAGHAFSTTVSVFQIEGKPIIAERAMWWRATNWPTESFFMEGTASAGRPLAGSDGGNDPTLMNWYLAEGNTDGFDDFILLSNLYVRDNAQVQIRYYLEDGSPIDRELTLSPSERRTINVRWDPEGIGKAARYGAMITSSLPTAVERSMYFNGGGFGWVGGHNSLASPGLSRKWMLPEGATVPGPVGNIRTEIQILNPQNVPANVEVRFLLDQGATHSEHITIPAQRRHTILANDIPELAAKAFSTLVLSSEPIVVDRTMYFDGDTPGLISPIGSTASAGIPASAISLLPKGYAASAAAIQTATSGDAWTLYSPTPTATVTPTPVLLE